MATDCGICQDQFVDHYCIPLLPPPNNVACNHRFCEDCILAGMENDNDPQTGQPRCALCRRGFDNYRRVVIGPVAAAAAAVVPAPAAAAAVGGLVAGAAAAVVPAPAAAAAVGGPVAVAAAAAAALFARTCQICHRVFAGRSGKSKHMEYAHTTVNNRPRCPVCLRNYASRQNLVRHRENSGH